MEMNNYTKIYCILGKILLGCAGAIVSFLTTGILSVVLGALAGFLAGHFLEKLIVNQSLTKN